MGRANEMVAPWDKSQHIRFCLAWLSLTLLFTDQRNRFVRRSNMFERQFKRIRSNACAHRTIDR